MRDKVVQHYVDFGGGGTPSSFTPGLFYFVQKQMKSSESFCIFPWGHFVFTLHYYEAGQSAQRLAGLSLRPYVTASCCCTRFALWGSSIMTTANESQVNLVRLGGEMSSRHLGRWTYFPMFDNTKNVHLFQNNVASRSRCGSTLSARWNLNSFFQPVAQHRVTRSYP